MFKFPFSNYQELNLDWILAKVKEFAELIPGMREVLDKSEQALDDATQAITTANEAKEIAQQAVQGIVGPNSVNTAAIQAGAVTREKIASRAVDSGRLAENAVYSINIADGEIVSNKIRAGAVTTAKIADGSVNTTKIADGAVTADKIAPGAIPQASIADGSVTTAKLADGAVTAAKLAGAAVNAEKIAQGAVTDNGLASGAVTTEKIANDAVTGDKIADGSITNAMLSSDFTFEKGMEMDLLWTNPSTSSPFQAQTISMKGNTNNYKYLMLLMTNPNNGYSLYTIVSGGINSVECIGGFSEASAPAICYRRTVNLLNTMATFSTCVGKNISTGIILDSPEIMIPLSIYGLK